MANQKITDMPVAASVADADIATIVQGGANKQVTALLLLKTPQDAADAAQVAADAAQSTADDALPKAGGDVTGDIDMGAGAQFVGHAPDGPTTPTFTWGGQQALMGMYAVDSDTIGFSVAGAAAAQVDPVGTAIPSPQTILTDEKAAAKYALISTPRTWQDVSGSRSVGVSYQNTTGADIQLYIMFSAGSLQNIEASSDNATWLNIGNSQSANAPNHPIIPDNWYYRVAAGTANRWMELR